MSATRWPPSLQRERLSAVVANAAVAALACIGGLVLGLIVRGSEGFSWPTFGLVVSFLIALGGGWLGGAVKGSADQWICDHTPITAGTVVRRAFRKTGIGVLAAVLPGIACFMAVALGGDMRAAAASVLAAATMLAAAASESMGPGRFPPTLLIAPWRRAVHIPRIGCALMFAAPLTVAWLGVDPRVAAATNAWTDGALAWHPAMVAPLLALNPFGTIGRMSESGALAGDIGDLALAVLGLVLAALLVRIVFRLRELAGADPGREERMWFRSRQRQQMRGQDDSGGDEPPEGLRNALAPPVVAPPWEASALPPSLGDAADPARAYLPKPHASLAFHAVLLACAFAAAFAVRHFGTPGSPAHVVQVMIASGVLLLVPMARGEESVRLLPAGSALPLRWRDARPRLANAAHLRDGALFAGYALALHLAMQAPWWNLPVLVAGLHALDAAWREHQRFGARADAGRTGALAVSNAASLLAFVSVLCVAVMYVASARQAPAGPPSWTLFMCAWLALPALIALGAWIAHAIARHDDDTALAPLERGT